MVGWVEGISLLLLLGFAMPLKYFYDDPIYVRWIGMAHGILFLLYVQGAFLLWRRDKWSMMKLLLCLILSSVPFGTFYFERRYL
jgi:integral membrane protein